MKALCNFMRQIVQSLGLSLFLLGACSVTQAEENPYATYYHTQSPAHLHSLQPHPEPKLFSGKHPNTDNIQMLEDGYDLMGFSAFDAGDIAPAQAIAHGRDIQADRILVYVKKAEDQESDENTQTYHYYATFWSKLPPAALGVHVIKLALREATRKNEASAPATPSAGVRVIAVIHGSVAEKNGIQRDDQLLSINQEKVEDAASLSTLVRKLKGKTVTVQLQRDGEPLSIQLSL